ncbi:putative ATPase domain archaeal protein [Acidianus two-tailed virus 2]|nr:putative ATPase domain archaeal protein [Acidianus two-tailed virus 2]
MEMVRILNFFEIKENATDQENIISAPYDVYIPLMKEKYEQIKLGRYDKIEYPENFPQQYRTGRGVAYFSEMVYEGFQGGLFNQFIVEGQQGAGKSSFALWVARAIYGNWHDALKHVVIDPFQLRQIILVAEANSITIPLIVVDDAGLFFSKGLAYKRQTGRMQTIQRVLQVIRTAVSNIVLTTPNEEELSGLVIRQPKQYKIIVEKRNEFVSAARVYEEEIQPLRGKKITRRLKLRDDIEKNLRTPLDFLEVTQNAHEVNLPRHIDDTAYQIYMKLRGLYTAIALRTS